MNLVISFLVTFMTCLASDMSEDSSCTSFNMKMQSNLKICIAWWPWDLFTCSPKWYFRCFDDFEHFKRWDLDNIVGNKSMFLTLPSSHRPNTLLAAARMLQRLKQRFLRLKDHPSLGLLAPTHPQLRTKSKQKILMDPFLLVKWTNSTVL